MAAPTNPDPTTERPPRSWRWIPLSVRMLASMVLLLGIGGLWLGARGYRQMVAIRDIEQAGGEVLTEKAGPEWLRARVGDEWMRSLDKVVRVDFYGLDRLDGTPVTDAELVNLKGLTELTLLSLDGTWVSDTGLEHLQGLTRLKSLSLCNTQVTDAGLKHLRGLADLEQLHIDSDFSRVSP